MNTRKLQEEKKLLKLNKRQRGIIVGLLLGDGHLETQNGGRTYRLKVEHSSAQTDYVRWLFTELREWIPAHAPYEKIRADGSKNIGFTTYSHGALRFYAQQFYEEKRKKIPFRVAQMLSPISLAVWFMDDGSRKSLRHHTYIIHTLGFSRKDLIQTQQALQKVFDLSVTLHQQKQKYWRLYIPSKSVQKFEQIIEPYVRPIESMKHKLVTLKPKK